MMNDHIKNCLPGATESSKFVGATHTHQDHAKFGLFERILAVFNQALGDICKVSQNKFLVPCTSLAKRSNQTLKRKPLQGRNRLVILKSYVKTPCFRLARNGCLQ